MSLGRLAGGWLTLSRRLSPHFCSGTWMYIAVSCRWDLSDSAPSRVLIGLLRLRLERFDRGPSPFVWVFPIDRREMCNFRKPGFSEAIIIHECVRSHDKCDVMM